MYRQDLDHDGRFLPGHDPEVTLLQAATSAAVDGFSATAAGDVSAEDFLVQLTSAVVRLLDINGAGMMVTREGDRLRSEYTVGRLAGRGGPVEALERLQEAAQSGPGVDSHREGRVLDIADLAAHAAWPHFQRTAVAAGLLAVTAVPLRVRGRSLGALTLYRSQARPLDRSELAAVLTLVNLATSFWAVADDRDGARRTQTELAHRAMHDPLTGLPVRWVFLEQLAHALARLARRPSHVGVLFLDLDGLKYVNDTYGHSAGDRLIVTCIDRVRAALRPSDVVARLGGDEFAVLLEDLTDVGSAAGIGQRILDGLVEPYRADGEVIQPSASVGLALTSDSDHTPEALIARADAAMYRAKQAGRGRLEVLDVEAYAADRAEATARNRMAASLRAALRSGQLELHYQPVLELSPDGASTRTGARIGSLPVHAVEALVRWRHPQRGLLPAGAFLDAAERYGLLVELGVWAVRTACLQLASWDATLGARSPRQISVNLSGPELSEPGLVRHVDACLQETGLAPQRLTVELAETGLPRDPEVVRAAVDYLHQLGCDLAIDHFGAGPASLVRLAEIPASTLKVDRSFVHGMDRRETASAVISAVLVLGRSLERTVVAKGVDSAATLHALQALGCRHLQGYQLVPPQPADRLAAMLAG